MKFKLFAVIACFLTSITAGSAAYAHNTAAVQETITAQTNSSYTSQPLESNGQTESKAVLQTVMDAQNSEINDCTSVPSANVVSVAAPVCTSKSGNGCANTSLADMQKGLKNSQKTCKTVSDCPKGNCTSNNCTSGCPSNNCTGGRPNNNTTSGNANSSTTPSAPAVSTGSVQAGTGFSEFQNKVVALVNAERKAKGLNALTVNVLVTKTAVLKSEDMAKLNYFDHNSPTYGSPFDMMKKYGISYKAAGENIAKGQTSPEQVMKAWMNSQGHRENILNPSFTQIGVGIAKDTQGQCIWTQQFIG